jgi:hypothetical protein
VTPALVWFAVGLLLLVGAPTFAAPSFVGTDPPAFAPPALVMRDAITLPIGQTADVPLVAQRVPASTTSFDLSLSYVSAAIEVVGVALPPTLQHCRIWFDADGHYISAQTLVVGGGLRIAIACPMKIGERVTTATAAPLLLIRVKALKRGKSLLAIRDCQIDEQPLDCDAATVIRTP